MTQSVDEIDQEIESIQSQQRWERTKTGLSVLALLAAVGVLCSLWYFTIALDAFNVADSRDARTALPPVTIMASIGGLVALLFLGGTILDSRDTRIMLGPTLDRARELRKITLAGGGTSRLQILNRYKNDLPETVEGFRVVARRYRRLHNFLQSIVMIGALGASAVLAIIGESVTGRVVAICATTTVTIAAAYSSYFRFKEKALSLQSTADSIEQEHRSVQLGIGEYEGKAATIALTMFAEKVEKMRAGQQRDALELDQRISIDYNSGPNYDLQ